MLADLESLEKRIVNLEKRAKTGDKESAQTLRPGPAGADELNAGRPAARQGLRRGREGLADAAAPDLQARPLRLQRRRGLRRHRQRDVQGGGRARRA
jgi:hypothetical protein